MNIWTKNQIEFLISYYPECGANFVADKLNRTRDSVLWKAKQLKVRSSENYIKNRCAKAGAKAGKFKLFIEKFKKIEEPEIAYILGFIWADGCLRNGNYSITFSNLLSDIEEIKHVFLKTGDWQFRVNKGKYCKCYVGAYDLFDFFIKNDFIDKSGKSAEKILTFIPASLRHFWWRGYLDGDGHIGLYGNRPRLTFTSTSQQDWSFTKFLPESPSIYSVPSRSHATVQSTEQILNVLDYIYKDYPSNKIGLTRKYRKYLDIRKHSTYLKNRTPVELREYQSS